MKNIEKTSLRKMAAKILRTEICQGRIPAGSKIIESKIAASLGISRTPLREALIQLEQEGFLLDKTNHGFRVSGFLEREAIDLYSILATLESLAVTQIETIDDEVAQKLEALNRKFASERNPKKLIQLDGQWHDTLLSTSENQTARSILATLRHRVQRYEFAFMAARDNVAGSADGHTTILELVLNQKQKKAAQVIHAQWIDSLGILKPLIQTTPSQ